MADRSVDSPCPVRWHTLRSEEVEQVQRTGPEGLTESEAGRRLREHGPNRLAPPKRRGPVVRMLMLFHNILLYVMQAAAVITAFLGHWVDTAVLLGAVLVNAVIGFIQEGKAEAALDAIRAMLAPHAMVIRDGMRREIDAAGLVPGDRVVLGSGGRVPADLRLVLVRGLRVPTSARLACCPLHRSRRNRNLQHSVPLMAEQLVGFLDIVESEAVRDHRAEVHAARLDHRHQAAHALFAPWAQTRHDLVVAEPGSECFQRNREVGSRPPGSTRCHLAATPVDRLQTLPAFLAPRWRHPHHARR